MEGVLRNRWFIVIQIIIIGGQVLIVFLGGKAFAVQRLDQPSQWAVSVLLGALAVPMGIMIRLVPDKVISTLILHMWSRPSSPELVDATGESRHDGGDLAMDESREQLAFMKTVRGGRLRHIIHKHPQVFFIHSRGRSRPRPTAVGGTAADDNSANADLASHPASERTPLISSSGRG
jgi:Ca2+-transporting ATPase